MSRGMRYDLAKGRESVRHLDPEIGTGSLPATKAQMQLMANLYLETGIALPKTHPTRNVARDWIKKARVRATLDAFR